MALGCILMRGLDVTSRMRRPGSSGMPSRNWVCLHVKESRSFRQINGIEIVKGHGEKNWGMSLLVYSYVYSNLVIVRQPGTM